MSLKWKIKQLLCVKHQSCPGSHMFRINLLRGAGCKDIWFGSRVGHFNILLTTVLFWTSNELHILHLSLCHFNKIYHRYFLTIWNLQCASIKSQNLFFFSSLSSCTTLPPGWGQTEHSTCYAEISSGPRRKSDPPSWAARWLHKYFGSK